MVLTVTEYYEFFENIGNFKSREAVARKVREGEIKGAHKNEKGMWVIDVDLPEDVYEAKKKSQKFRCEADGIWFYLIGLKNEREKLQKEIDNTREMYEDKVEEIRMCMEKVIEWENSQ